MHDETRFIEKADGRVGAAIRRPDGDGPFPVIVYFHHGPGLDEGSKEAMGFFADAGYYVIGPDRYNRAGDFLTHVPGSLAPGSEAQKQFRSRIQNTTDDMVEVDVQAVLAFLETDPAARSAPMGCAGYCVGARTVIRTMVAHSDVFLAGAAFHPSFCVTPEPDSPSHSVAELAGSIYVAIGTADTSSSPEDNKPLIEAVESLGDRGMVDLLDGAVHGFAVPGPGWHEEAATRAYRQAIALFDRILK